MYRFKITKKILKMLGVSEKPQLIHRDQIPFMLWFKLVRVHELMKTRNEQRYDIEKKSPTKEKINEVFNEMSVDNEDAIDTLAKLYQKQDEKVDYDDDLKNIDNSIYDFAFYILVQKILLYPSWRLLKDAEDIVLEFKKFEIMSNQDIEETQARISKDLDLALKGKEYEEWARAIQIYPTDRLLQNAYLINASMEKMQTVNLLSKEERKKFEEKCGLDELDIVARMCAKYMANTGSIVSNTQENG
jgi:hypothetical protein